MTVRVHINLPSLSTLYGPEEGAALSHGAELYCEKQAGFPFNKSVGNKNVIRLGFSFPTYFYF